jgi:Uma2 family endonuclease
MNNAQVAPSPDRVDQRVCLHGASWADYERLLAVRGESSGTRITYLEGELELMTPSVDHELLKITLGRLIEAWADETGTDLQGAGSWTLKKKLKERGAEPDECYVVGAERMRSVKVPDFACEIVWTHGGIGKLEVYRGLGVPEVWFFQDGTLSFHVLEDGKYVRATRSRAVPTLDPRMIEACMRISSQTEAVRKLRAAMRRAPRKKGRGSRRK